ncbi:MAG: 3-keto-disaccharide hydrolase [Planctomycetota bacterium]
MSRWAWTGVLAVAMGLSAAAAAGQAEDKALPRFWGDWEGTWKAGEGEEQELVAQVIDWGKDGYQANLLAAFNKRIPPLVVLKGKREGETVTLTGRASKGPLDGTAWTATITRPEGARLPKFEGTFAGGGQAGTFALKRVVRLSPSLGKKPPEGAVVLFDGESLDGWVRKGGRPCRWKLLDDGSMEVRGGGIISKHKFTDHRVHVEFRTPFLPNKRGQGRGNSGVYLQGRYEVQVLDSYGLEGRSNECGGIYGVGAPKVNMCAPPLQWQTYDITFRAPRFDDGGKLIKHARMTVAHNGVVIHDDVRVPKPTTACWDRNIRQPGGLHLQDHGNPVRYRNIWAVETEGEE